MTDIRLPNLISVGIFGMILSAAFCDIFWTRKKLFAMSAGMAAILLFQGIFYFGAGAEVVEEFYPFITHIPLAVVLCILNRNCLWPPISKIYEMPCGNFLFFHSFFCTNITRNGTINFVKSSHQSITERA